MSLAQLSASHKVHHACTSLRPPPPSPSPCPGLEHRGLMFADSLLQQKARTGKQGCDISSQGEKKLLSPAPTPLSRSVGG